MMRLKNGAAKARTKKDALAKQGKKISFGMVHEIGLTDSCVILIDVGGPADGAAFIVTSRH